MPHSTNNYLFEMRVAEAVGNIVESKIAANIFTEDMHDKPVIIYFDTSGNADCQPITEDIHLLKDKVQTSDTSYILRDPFELEYMWLEWNRISRSLIESILGFEIKEKEFVNFRDKSVKEFPESWSVMF